MGAFPNLQHNQQFRGALLVRKRLGLGPNTDTMLDSQDRIVTDLIVTVISGVVDIYFGDLQGIDIGWGDLRFTPVGYPVWVPLPPGTRRLTIRNPDSAETCQATILACGPDGGH